MKFIHLIACIHYLRAYDRSTKHPAPTWPDSSIERAMASTAAETLVPPKTATLLFPIFTDPERKQVAK